jgi:glutathione-regulated potassium-efflux system protein KefB
VVVRETLHSSLEMGQMLMEALGVPPDVAAERRRRFQAHDERVLKEQYLIYDDEAALIASADQNRRDLDKLFEADAEPTPEELAEATPKPLPLD